MYNIRIYTGKSLEKENTTPTNVVMNLSQNVFNKSNTLYTDNYYTIVDLANKLISKNTHLAGTLSGTLPRIKSQR